ncbi:hsp70 family protein [Candidatus Laterigemmans baculatus]|uniref:hsp70 family protein n=1 Tax=Candidatus Laterigemmans baculatus TaxID=2770505 RepID=UPI0013DCD369|nr:hsp70 family protein [Candidatus Laterigemmans baculatus]
MSTERGATSAEETAPRYVVGIDLGTTNCAAAYVDCTAEPWRVETLAIPQWVDWGQVERRQTLPSFHYEWEQGARESLRGGLPWEQEPPEYVVGVLARDAGMRNPGRRIASAKSWLSHDGVDRSAELLPWQGDADVTRLSPVDVSARYLAHIRAAWDEAHPEYPLAEQDVVITLPASFDEVARELTVAAARRAGLPRVYLIEEPQAAFYAWIDRHRDDWHTRVGAGQMILVCDIGGGTSDFTLIRVRPAGDDESQVQFHRVAVGRHLILGGDNLDLALAKYTESRLSPDAPLPPRDWDRLIQACRGIKETMLSSDRPDEATLSLTSEGSRLIAGARTLALSAEEVDRVLVDGFFPEVPREARPTSGASGFREFGLPYADDPAVTRHLAEFLAEHARAGLSEDEHDQAVRPELVLFNGGVMAAARIRDRIVDSVGRWFGDGSDWKPTTLDADRLDLAVAHGAAYYGMVRRGRGVRIAANLGRSYYIEVDDAPPETMCLIPGSAEPGQTFAPPHRLRLEVGVPVQFPLWVSSTRLADAAGDLVAIDRQALTPLPPIRTVLVRGRRREQQTTEVTIETQLSEIGTLGLYCVDTESSHRWRLEFDIRATLETDREVHTGSGEAAGIVDAETVAACSRVIREAFTEKTPGPDGIAKRLRRAADLDRSQWPPSLLREMWQTLMDVADGRRRSAKHEARWLNLVGYCLRPGYGMAVDDWRVGEVWRSIHGKLAFPSPASRTESLILWRRIAGGLSAGQQQQLTTPLAAMLSGKGLKPEPHEAAELWRMVGSLEWLSAEAKLKWAEAALEAAAARRSEPYRDALLWAVGRLTSRQPIYGPLNTVVPAAAAAEILKRLIQSESTLGPRQLAVMQIAHRVEDRYRDLPEAARDKAAAWLTRTAAPEHYAQLVLEGGAVRGDEEAALFGESLPLGIKLLRSVR